jgi:hypothetical protein
MEHGATLLRRAGIRFGTWNRARKLRHALDFAAENHVSSVLLIGVHTTGNREQDNLIERGLAAHLPRAVGIGLAADGPSWVDYHRGDGRDLPFGDGEFDLVFSNAVIEHVGDAADQQRFVDEHVRVGRHWMLTTPNRAFPVEAHEHTLFSHWRSGWRPRSSVTRLLTPRDLRRLLPPDARIRGSWASPTLTAYGPGQVSGASRS